MNQQDQDDDPWWIHVIGELSWPIPFLIGLWIMTSH